MGQNYICPVAAGQIKDCIHLRRRKRRLDVCGTSLCRLGCAGGSLVQGRENHRAQSQRFQKSAEPWNGVTAPGQPSELPTSAMVLFGENCNIKKTSVLADRCVCGAAFSIARHSVTVKAEFVPTN